MAQVDWSDDLKVGVDFIDDDHHEFVTLLNACINSADAELAAAVDALYAHTVAHFAREEELMDQTGFFASDCHKGEHGRVLNEMRRFRAHLDKGNVSFVRAWLADHVPQWFLLHRNTMDAATAAFARQKQAA